MVLAIGVTAVKLIVAFRCVSLPINWDAALVLAASFQLGAFLGITPGALGLREGLIGVTAGLLGLSLEQAVFAATVDRCVLLLLIFAFAVTYIRMLGVQTEGD